MTQGKAAILARVSDGGQHSENQVPDLIAWAVQPGKKSFLIFWSTQAPFVFRE